MVTFPLGLAAARVIVGFVPCKETVPVDVLLSTTRFPPIAKLTALEKVQVVATAPPSIVKLP